MKYDLEVLSLAGVKRRYIDFGETEGVRGNIRIVFERGDDSRDWIVQDANIPLFLSNLLLFLDQVEVKGAAVFTAQFSPNSNGEMRDGTLLLSRLSGDDFDVGIYDETGPADLAALRSALVADVDRFGALIDV